MRESRIAPHEWPEALASVDGPQLVVGGPGTGKTEFLVRRVVELIERRHVPTERVLILGFSRRGVGDLRARITAALTGSFTTLAAATFHSLASSIVETHGADRGNWTTMPALLTGPEQVALVSELLAAEDPNHWPDAFRPLLTMRTLARETTDFLLRCQERRIDPTRLAQLTRLHADWRALPQFYERYLQVLRDRRRIDYGTLLATAVDILDDAEARDRISQQWDHILVDEYQDTSAAQEHLLLGLYANHRNITVAADPYQSIYSFRGTELENVAKFTDRFLDGDEEPAKRIVLTTSFRVPSAILDAAVRVTAGGELPGAAGAVVPSDGAGAVETYGFQQQTEEAEWIAGEIARLHVEQQIPYGGMAVFVRTKKRFLSELSRALDRRHIPHDPPDARLSDQPAVRLVLDIVIAATETGVDEARACRRLLLGPLFSLSIGRFRELEAVARQIGWLESVAQLPDASQLEELLAAPSWAEAEPAIDGFWRIWSTLPQLVDVVSDPARQSERAAWTSLAQVLSRLFERNPKATLVDYLRMVESEDFEARPLLAYQQPAVDRVTLTTLHQSKGLEFDVVFIPDASEGVFPDLRTRHALLEIRHLSPSLGTDYASFARFRLQEEMRLAYTAMTRARRRVVWTTTRSGLDDAGLAPSRFLPMVAGTDAMREAVAPPPEWTTPATAAEAEAWLRRLIRDPAAPGPERAAAVDVLASAVDHGLRSPDQIAGVRARGPDTGVVGAKIVMSPSQAESYEQCPRRYALEKRVGVGSDSSVYLEFGNLIHRVLERAELEAVAATADHATAEAALRHLEAEWDPARFGGDPWATAWKRRAEDALTRLYTKWPGRAAPIAIEHDLETEIGGVEWRGRADRIEAIGDNLHIVDYKTTRNPLTKTEAAASLQLGFYMIAAAADRRLSGTGTPASAEMWYPVVRAKSVITRGFDPGNLAELADRLSAAADGIEHEDWTPRPGEHCARCPVRLVCPGWPEGKEAYAS